MPRWDPKDYAGNSSEQARWAAELADRMNLAGGESLLDIGSGDGKVTANLARNLPGGMVWGVDSSPDMVAHSRNAFPPESNPNLEFHLAHAADLHLGRRFQVIFSNACLHWVLDHAPVLDGIRRHLEPGGRVFLSMGGRGNARTMRDVVEETIALPPWQDYFQGFEFPYGFHHPTDYAVWAEKAGLKKVRARLVPKTMNHKGAEALAGWVRTTWLPYTERLPGGMRENFIKTVVERHLELHHPDCDGTVSLPMVRLEVEAEG